MRLILIVRRTVANGVRNVRRWAWRVLPAGVGFRSVRNEPAATMARRSDGPARQLGGGRVARAST
ncbi:MAG: hypothetical protein JW888_13295 [Pirellulales bacterium]|nr:hypothetical protein [Pirellulales bacterium]